MDTEHTRIQVLEEEALKYHELPAEEVLQAARFTSRRSIKAAERAATKAAKEQRAREIDENAKLAREAELAAGAAARMAAALAEPADIGRSSGRRRKHARCPGAKVGAKGAGDDDVMKGVSKCKKLHKVVPDWDFDDDMANETVVHDDEPSMLDQSFEERSADSAETPQPSDDDCTSAGASEPFSALPIATPVMVDGREEWAVDKISDRKFFREKGRVVPKWKVEWHGGDVTWERHHRIKDCAALADFESQRKLRKRSKVE